MYCSREPSLPSQSQHSFVAAPVRDVAVDRLVGDVEAAAGQAIEFADHVRVDEVRARLLVVVEVRADAELLERRLRDGWIVHCYLALAARFRPRQSSRSFRCDQPAGAFAVRAPGRW